MKLHALLAAIAAVAVACTDAKTVVDPDVTAIEIVTRLDASDGVTQLQISGTIGENVAFAPGMVPDVPRALTGEHTAIVLLPTSLDGVQVLVRVDALADGTIVRTGVAPATIRAEQTRQVAVTLGEPAVCGDGRIRAPFEACDDTNTTAGDGCSASCTAEPGWICGGMPSNCRPFATTKELTAFVFGSVNNPGLGADVHATITGTTISATVPNGTNIGALVATFATTGAQVTVTGTAQVSGTTANDFMSIVIYQVTAEDGSTKSYAVVVTVASGTAKDLTSFAFLSMENPGLGADVAGTITGTTISLTVPFGTTVTALVATYSTTGTSVRVAGVTQVSGTTANDFTNPVTYRVAAADSSTTDYTVTVTVASGTAKSLTSFAFLSVDNAGLAADVAATIVGTAVSLAVPAGTNVTALVATFSTTGTSVKVAGVTQVSGTTINSFTSAVIYRVTAADASTRDYTVTVTVTPSGGKDLTAYAFRSVNNPVLAADVAATITGTAISLTVPFGTNVTALVATFSTTGANVRVGGTVQVSGTTAQNLTSPVVYRVTAADASTKDYTVTVTVAGMTAKDLTAFAFRAVDNQELTVDAIGTITGTNISLTVPIGTNVTQLVATFSTTGVSVTVAGAAQASGQNSNDFSNPVVYRVTAADASTKDYTVTVTLL